jgi:hypothetical protein
MARFDEIDVDNSGLLEIDEMAVLLKKMGREESSQKSMQSTMAEIATIAQQRGNAVVAKPESTSKRVRRMSIEILSSVGLAQKPSTAEIQTITRKQFTAWFEYQISIMVSTPYDILYGTTHYHAYWWFFQVLLLKTFINIVYSLGMASEFEWHVWMHLVLGISLSLMVLVAPYRSVVDFQVELLALVCLAVVSHVASLYETGEKFQPGFLTLTGSMGVTPLIGLVVLKWANRESNRPPGGQKGRCCRGGVRVEEVPPPPPYVILY